jgi:hypothetical protein
MSPAMSAANWGAGAPGGLLAAEEDGPPTVTIEELFPDMESISEIRFKFAEAGLGIDDNIDDCCTRKKLTPSRPGTSPIQAGRFRVDSAALLNRDFQNLQSTQVPHIVAEIPVG